MLSLAIAALVGTGFVSLPEDLRPVMNRVIEATEGTEVNCKSDLKGWPTVNTQEWHVCLYSAQPPMMLRASLDNLATKMEVRQPWKHDGSEANWLESKMWAISGNLYLFCAIGPQQQGKTPYICSLIRDNR